MVCIQAREPEQRLDTGLWNRPLETNQRQHTIFWKKTQGEIPVNPKSGRKVACYVIVHNGEFSLKKLLDILGEYPLRFMELYDKIRSIQHNCGKGVSLR